MAVRNISTFGIYADRTAAQEAADALQRIGFRDTDISILVPDNMGTKDFGHEKHSRAPEGATVGALIGVALGACFGWIASAGHAPDVSWLTQFAALSPIWAVLSGMGAGSVIGLLLGALVGASAPVYEAFRYEGRTRKGGVLLSAHCDNLDWTKRAKDMLRQTGAKDIAATSEAKADFGATEKPMLRTRNRTIVLDGRMKETADFQPDEPVLRERPAVVESEPVSVDSRFQPEVKARP